MRFTVPLLLAAAATLPSASAAELDLTRETYLLIDSQPGDIVGLGQVLFYTPDDSRIVPGFAGHGGVWASVYGDADWPPLWDVTFFSQNDVPLRPGAYEDAIHSHPYPYPFNTLDPRRSGFGCQSTGRYEVLAIEFAGQAAQRVAIDFESRCNDATAGLTGKLRYAMSPDVLPVARAGDDRPVLEGARFSLDGRASSDDGRVTAYRWTQFAGPAVQLTGADTATPSIVAAPLEATTLGFRLEVTDDSGFKGFDTIDVNVAVIDSDLDGDGVRDSIDPDMDGDGADNDADLDDDGDGVHDRFEALAPGGDGNGDGLPDSRQPEVRTMLDHAGEAITLEAGPGVAIREAVGGANPDRAGSPPGLAFERGFITLILDVAPGDAATVTLFLHGAPRPASYWKYDHTTASFYEFLHDGTTGAQILPDRVVLHFVDGGRGDHDGTVNGRIVDPGGPVWPVSFGGGGLLAPGALAVLLVAAFRRRRAG